MPLSKDASKTLANMKRQYGSKKGTEVFYRTMNKHGLDDTKSLKDQGHKLKAALAYAYSNDAWERAHGDDGLMSELQCLTVLGEVYKDSVVESQAARIKAERETSVKNLTSEINTIAKQFPRDGDSLKASDFVLNGEVTGINKFQGLGPNAGPTRYDISIRTTDGKTMNLPLPAEEIKEYRVGDKAKITVSIKSDGHSMFILSK